MYASEKGLRNVVGILLLKGADSAIKDYSQKTGTFVLFSTHLYLLSVCLLKMIDQDGNWFLRLFSSFPFYISVLNDLFTCKGKVLPFYPHLAKINALLS